MSGHHARHDNHFWRLWGWPIVLGVLTTIGLVSALFSDGGFGDALAWVALGIPVAVGAWYGWRRQPSSS
ncbi:hypothetical protein QTH87_02870 [Variovorax sp. J22P168]|uniref:hypothetical protein n=1 Tax=Variovorax jilinensis TaxID=3053513 RepID=UPI002575C628|nr:hypothetical protein [Variovorax sp. J22P168]MDM0011373.1 hypothetical protein [Variovorax sp. J22P168]